MKNILGNSNFGFSKWCVALIAAGWMGAAQAAVLIDHNFSSFNTGDLVGQQGWTQIGSAASPNLTIGSGVVNLSASGQDAGVAFTSANSGSIYLGYKIRVTASTTGGDYFGSFNTSANGTSYTGRIFIKRGATTSKFVFGLQIGVTGATPVYGTTELDTNTDHIIILKYNFISGTANDTGLLYVNPSNLSTEGSNTPYVNTVTWSGSSSENASLAAASIRQGGSTTGAAGTIARLLVSNDWASVAALAAPASGPSITTTGTLNPFTATAGTASAAQTFSVTGANLTANITVTAPTNFEVASDGATFGSTATIAQSGGSASGTVSVRVAANAPAGPVSGNVTLASTSATGSVAVNGTVTDPNAPAPQSDLIITGIIDAPRTGGLPKAIEIYVVNSVADLSIYKVQSYANGGTTPSTPLALTGSATAGQYLYVASESPEFTAYFGFAPTATGSALNVNGNDVVALTKNDALVDVFGTIGVDPAVDTAFNYLDTWFYRKSSTGPSPTFNLADWMFPTGQSDALDSLGGTGVNPAVGNALRMPIGTFTSGSGGTGPTITSTNAYSGTVGVEFSNTITATGSAPIAFSGTDLPGGLSVATNGVISGTPTAAGIFTNAVLTATNAAGTNNQAVTFTIAKGTPVISLAPTASAITAGAALSSSTLTGGSASVEGTFAWTTPSVVPNATGTYSVTFTPTDTLNYNTATTTVSVTVNPAGSTFTDWSGGSTLDSAGLAKYAIGGASSLTANDGVKPTTALTGGFLVITAIVRTDNSDLTVVGQAVTDLANYASNTSVTVVSGVEVADQSDVPAGHKRKTFSVAQGTDARKFMRLSASLALSGANTTVSVARDSGGATFLQVTGATAGSTSGGTATSEKRAVYYFAPDTTSSPTYTGGAWPYVIVQGQLSAGAGVTATLTKNSSGMLLVNGLPAYQFGGDSSSTTANGVGGTWPGMKADGTKTTTGPSGTIQ